VALPWVSGAEEGWWERSAFAATPQVAAAVALWYEKYKNFLGRDWHRVEAVRHALFTSAKARGADPQHFGNGILQANTALSVAPNLTLPQTPADNDSFSFFRVITGLGLTDAPPREQMFNLELTQRYLANQDLQDIIPDPEKPMNDQDLRRFMDAVIQDDQASLALRKHIAARYPSVAGTPLPDRAPRSHGHAADLVPTRDESGFVCQRVSSELTDR